MKIKEFFKTHGQLAVLLFVITLFSIYNFSVYSKFEYPDWDGFQYLSFSKSVLSGEEAFLDPIRSPVLALIIPPDMVVARIAMIIFHILTALVVYGITFKITKNELASLFSTSLYGFSWWMLAFLSSTLSDLPAIFFFLLSLYLLLDKNDKYTNYAGLFAGLAFIVRFDMLLLILPMALMFVKSFERIKNFMFYFFMVAVVFELASSYAVFGRLVYPPWEFFKLNFLQGFASYLAAPAGTDMLFVAHKSLELYPLLVLFPVFSLFGKRDGHIAKLAAITIFFFAVISFMPVSDNRIFAVKLIPLLSILSSSFSQIAIFKRGRFKHVMAALMATYILFNVYLLGGITYPEWRLSDTYCPAGGIICTNAPPIVNYYCGLQARDTGMLGNRYVGLDGSFNATEAVLYNLKYCNYFIYYKDYFHYSNDTNLLVASSNELIDNNSVSFVYRISKATR